MQIIHTEPRESEEAAEIVRGLGWLLHNDQLEAGSFARLGGFACGAPTAPWQLVSVTSCRHLEPCWLIFKGPSAPTAFGRLSS